MPAAKTGTRLGVSELCVIFMQVFGGFGSRCRGADSVVGLKSDRGNGVGTSLNRVSSETVRWGPDYLSPVIAWCRPHASLHVPPSYIEDRICPES